AKIGDNEIALDYEPIIYKSGVYLSSKDLEKILKDNYRLELSKDKIFLEYIGTKGKVKEAFAYGNNTDSIISIGNKRAYAGSYGFALITIILVFLIFKKDREI
ncbi:MAG: N-acyl-D-glutamate deacylase, partial [Tissierellia bacterium]|nr:N-acyl-D-glutamate deacylase [Tissierellia bacterium]